MPHLATRRAWSSISKYALTSQGMVRNDISSKYNTSIMFLSIAFIFQISCFSGASQPTPALHDLRTCKECDLRFATSGGLKRHLLAGHEDMETTITQRRRRRRRQGQDESSEEEEETTTRKTVKKGKKGKEISPEFIQTTSDEDDVPLSKVQEKQRATDDELHRASVFSVSSHIHLNGYFSHAA